MARPIYCDMHRAIFRSSGITIIVRKLVFNFCARCWRHDKAACEAHAHRMAEGVRHESL